MTGISAFDNTIAKCTMRIEQFLRTGRVVGLFFVEAHLTSDDVVTGDTAEAILVKHLILRRNVLSKGDKLVAGVTTSSA